MAEKQNIFWGCRASEGYQLSFLEKIMRDNPCKQLNGHVHLAYFGRHMWENATFGLNVTVMFDGGETSTLTYTKMQDIESLMNAFHAKSIEQFQGKKVTAYMLEGLIAAGLSVRRQE